MDAERYQRVKELLGSVLDLDPDQREPFLLRECHSDRVLYAVVRSLIEAHVQAQSFLESSTETHFLGARLARSEDGVPRSIGPYRILQRIGAGGMGEVFLAKQEQPVVREVALKLIRSDMTSKDALGRFESERQALALMNHSNIARVFDAGATDDGRAYFAMELVKGVPITEHCDRHRLSTEERLELFIQVCAGVQHAHQKGIIHRDIKPSNVLVAITEKAAEPKIIDFGVAKATSLRLTPRTLHTELGRLIGTPEYMSPEQAEMTSQDIDTRADVYSLGVLLYELLVGALPFEPAELRAASFDEIRRRIREDEPTKPSAKLKTLGDRGTDSANNRRTDPGSLYRQLRGDLDWITLKALAKDRTRRYGSPNELAADVRRYLKREPIEARPPSAWYKTRRFVQRNRAVVLGSGAAVGVLILGIVATSLAWSDAERARDLAEQGQRQAQAATDFLTNDLLGWLLFRDEYDLTVPEVLDHASNEVAAAFGDQPAVEAQIRYTLGKAYLDLDQPDKARQELERSLMLREELYGESLETAAALFELANTGPGAEAIQRMQRVLEIRRSLLGETDPLTLEAVGFLALFKAQQRGDPASGLDPAFMWSIALLRGKGESVAELRDKLNRIIFETERLWASRRREDALTLLRSQVEPLLPITKNQVTASLVGFGVNVGYDGYMNAAEALFTLAVQLGEEILTPDSDQTIFGVRALAELYRMQGDYEAARSYYERALASLEKTLGPAEGNLELVWTMLRAAFLYEAMGDEERAAVLLMEVERARPTAYAKRAGRIEFDQACAHAARGELDEAKAMLRVAEREGFPGGGLWKVRCTDFWKLRGDAEFDAIIDQIEAQANADSS